MNQKNEGNSPQRARFRPVKQTIRGNVPSKSNCYKIITLYKQGKPHSSLGKSDKLRAYEKAFFMQCSRYRNANIDGPFEFEMDVFYPTNMSDLDNSLKCVLDCLQSEHVRAIKNDRNCVGISVRKFIDKADPRIEFIIKPIETNV